MESKLALQYDNLNNIVKARLNFKKAPKERITDVYVHVRLEALEKLWDVFAETHRTLIEKFGSKLSDHDYTKNDMYDEAEECYLEYKTELKSISLLVGRDTIDKHVCAGTTHDETKSQTIQLPKIVIPQFSISILDLPTYQQSKDFLTKRNGALEFIDNKHSANKTNTNSNVKTLHVSECHHRHHTLLHPKSSDTPETTDVNLKRGSGMSVSQEEPEPSTGGGSVKTENLTSLVSCFSTGKIYKQVLLATALVKAESKFGDFHVLRALLDQGSQGNFVTERTVQDLKLKNISLKSKISGLRGDQELLSKSIVYMKIRSRVNPHCIFTFKAHVLSSITTLLPTRKVNELEWSELGGIELADPNYHQPNKIDLLLGADMYSQLINEGFMRSLTGSLIAQSTALGWILSGVVDSSVTQTEGVLALHCQVQKEEDLLKRFRELELNQKASSQRKLTDEEILSEELFKAQASLLLGHMKPVAETDIKNKQVGYLAHHKVVKKDRDKVKESKIGEKGKGQVRIGKKNTEAYLEYN